MDQLLTPAHLHLALNHTPIIGLAVASLPILVGILFRSRGALASGLVAALLCVATVPAIMETGEGAQESFADGSIVPGMDIAAKAAFREHSGRAKFTAPVAYAAGLLALVSLAGLWKFPRQASWLAWAVLAGNAATIALGVWTAEAGGRIRHPEFRAVPNGVTDFSRTSTTALPAVFYSEPEAAAPPTAPTALATPISTTETNPPSPGAPLNTAPAASPNPSESPATNNGM